MANVGLLSDMHGFIFFKLKKKTFLVDVIEFGESKTPHVAALPMATKSMSRWVFEEVKRDSKEI